MIGQRAFFGHLDVEVFSYESDVEAVGETTVLRTFAAADWGLTLFLHMVDFLSISTIRRVMPVARKQMTLVQNPSLVDKFSFQGRLLIHAGRTWNNRTFPDDWWQEVVDLCSKVRKCVLIGDNSCMNDYEKGVVNITCPPGCVDLRNQTTIDELIALLSTNDVLSNDSFPAHAAGAFDNWIFMIPTVKHPEFLVPFRKGGQTYKTCCPIRRLMMDDLLPVESDMKFDDIPKGFTMLDYIPKPEEVVQAVTHDWKSPRDGSILWFP